MSALVCSSENAPPLRGLAVKREIVFSASISLVFGLFISSVVMCLLAILVLKHSRIASSSSLPHVCQLELPCPWLSDSPGSSGIISLSVSLFDGLGELRKIFWSDSEVLAAFFNSCLIGLNFSAVFGLSLIRSAKSFFKWAWSLCTAEKSSLSERCWTYTINFELICAVIMDDVIAFADQLMKTWSWFSLVTPVKQWRMKGTKVRNHLWMDKLKTTVARPCYFIVLCFSTSTMSWLPSFFTVLNSPSVMLDNGHAMSLIINWKMPHPWATLWEQMPPRWGPNPCQMPKRG